jgi:hypothetical protein
MVDLIGEKSSFRRWLLFFCIMQFIVIGVVIESQENERKTIPSEMIGYCKNIDFSRDSGIFAEMETNSIMLK